MEDLPEELTIDILSRLAVKTIIHCKCVCKKWRNLVLESSFVNLHLSRSPTGFIFHHIPCPRKSMRNIPVSPGILKWVEIEDEVNHHHLHHQRFMSVDLFDLAPIPQNTRMHQMGSVNGLICLSQYIFQCKVVDTYICNPVTREYMILPRPRYYTQDFAIIFYGFGVSSVTGEYKVVRIFQEKKSRNGLSVSEAEVYTLGTGQWRSLLGPVTYWLNGFNEYYGPFLNNHCHWIVSDEEDVPEMICTFDLDKETFHLFPSPPSEAVQENQAHYESLAVLKGCLCKVYTYDSELTIWVMKEYGMKKSWHKEVVITQGMCVDVEWPVWEPIRLIKGFKDGSILMIFEDKLCVFDPPSETIEDTKMFDPDLCCGLAYCPSFLKLQNFESERVQMF